MKKKNGVGKRIKIIRESKGISAKYVAGKLQIHASTYGKYENCDRKIDADLLPEIAEILDSEVADFFKKKVDETSNTA